MTDDKPHLIQELAEWLKENANPIYKSLNPGAIESPPAWPKKLRDYYSFYNGQKRDSDFLFPQDGNWLSLEQVAAAHKTWLGWAEEYDFDWYKESYVPIVAYPEDMQSVTVIDIETGQVGNVDLERQEFSLLFDDIDILFSDLLHELKTDGYPPETEYKTWTEAELGHFKYQEALKIEEEHRQSNDSPSAEQLFIWAIELFRRSGDPQFSEPDPHIMRLAKKYFDQISLSQLSQKQLREIAFFNHRYQQIIKE